MMISARDASASENTGHRRTDILTLGVEFSQRILGRCLNVHSQTFPSRFPLLRHLWTFEMQFTGVSRLSECDIACMYLTT